MLRPKQEAAQKPYPGVEPGDFVYVRHASRGPIAVKVLAMGQHGLQGECDMKGRHKVLWGDVLGHKARMLHRLTVVDQGADGAIVQDAKGKRRYLQGEVPVAEEPKPKPLRTAAAATKDMDDPLTGGMARLTKAAVVHIPDDAAVLFFKADGPAFKPRVGDTVEFMTDRQTGKGPSSGRVTDVSSDGQTAMISHSDAAHDAYECPYVEVHQFVPSLRHWMLKAGMIANQPGLTLKDVTDKAGHQTKRWVRSVKPQPKERQPSAGGEAEKPALKHGDVASFRHGDVQGEGRIIASGADGVTLQDKDGREHHVRHEHLTGPAKPGPTAEGEGATPAGEQAKPAAPAKPTDGTAETANPPPLFPADAVSKLPAKANQPVKDEAELYEKSGEALGQLQEWLDKGKGVAAQLGYETMSKGMEDVDWSKPGGMLFIAPLKGKKRAAEKVASDYGGDWSQLRDVVRCSIAVDTLDDLKGCLGALQKSGLKLAMQPKDRFHKPLPCGYRDLLMNVEFGNGLIGEVQLHVKPMLAAKEEGHQHYEVERTLLAKGEENWTDEDKAKVEAAHAAQVEIYGNAWKASIGGAAEGGELRKAMTAAAYDFVDHDGATFRRRRGKVSWAVDDVLHGDKWEPYTGDALEAGQFGDSIDAPENAGGESGDGGEPMEKAASILLLKAVVNDPGKDDGWIGVDFDGTLAHYDGWQGEGHVGEPIGPMVDRVRQWIAEGRDVRIVSARASAPASVKAIKAWCMQHLGTNLPVTDRKDHAMRELWDDRCVQVTPNTGQRADGVSG